MLAVVTLRGARLSGILMLADPAVKRSSVKARRPVPFKKKTKILARRYVTGRRLVLLKEKSLLVACC